jgi:hypothetical protein
MKNLIGGLFETQENANRAYQALQDSGFPNNEISMFIQKPRNRTIRATEVSIHDIARNAFLGGLILGTIGAFLGFLIGTGRIALPGLEPGSVDFNPAFLFASVMAGIVGGGLTGIILGVASKLLRSREKAEVMTRKINREACWSHSALVIPKVKQEPGVLWKNTKQWKWAIPLKNGI